MSDADASTSPAAPGRCCSWRPSPGASITLSLAPFALWPAALVGCALFRLSAGGCTAARRRGAAGCSAWACSAAAPPGSTSASTSTAMPRVPLAGALTPCSALGLGLLHALQAWLYVRLVRMLPGGMLLGFAALWTLFEWLRSWLLTGFPWLYLGYAHIDTWLAGWAPITGVYGLSFAIAFSASCLFLAWRSRQTATLVSYGGLLATLWIGGLMLKPIEWVAPASERPLSVAHLPAEHPPRARSGIAGAYPSILASTATAWCRCSGTMSSSGPSPRSPAVRPCARFSRPDRPPRRRSRDTTLITGIPTRDAAGRYHNSIIALGIGAASTTSSVSCPSANTCPSSDWLRGLIDFFDLPMSDFSAAATADQGALQRRQPPRRAADLLRGCLCRARGDQCTQRRTAGHDQQRQLVRTLDRSPAAPADGPHARPGERPLPAARHQQRRVRDHRSPRAVVARSEQFVETVLTGKAQVMLGHTPFTSFGSTPLLASLLVLLVLMSALYRTLWADLGPRS
jgi:apolipoprotein N-acyltransferase